MMSCASSHLSIRLTQKEDAASLKTWFGEPGVLRWFPMLEEKEVDDAVRLWIGYERLQAGLTAEWEGKICGLSNLYICPYQKLAHQCLFSIIVAEEYRGRGIGKALLQALMQRAKEHFQIELLHLEVYEGNPAFFLYEKMGFKVLGKQKHFIKENGAYVDKIFMEKHLYMDEEKKHDVTRATGAH